jgi:hypothetical protein
MVERRPSQSGYKQLDANVRFWPILLKKSAIVSTAEKYALEIEIFALCRGFRAKISHRCAQKRRFQQPYAGSLEGPPFSTESADCCLSPRQQLAGFCRLGYERAGQIQCK